jgi:Flp pilus assembly protein TadG
MTKTTKFHAFLRNQCGVVAPMFAIVLLTIFATSGFAVDGARWFNAKRHTSNAVDAGVLAAARLLQMDPTNTEAALAAGKVAYNANIAARLAVKNDSIDFVLTDNGRSVAVTGDATIQPVFLHLIGIDELSLLPKAAAKATFTASGLNEGTNLEISLMLDFTGSMCDDGEGPCTSGTKVQGLRDAATDLINIVVQADQTQYTQRVAIVP